MLAMERHDDVDRVLTGVMHSARRGGWEGVAGFTGALLSEVAFRRGRFAHALLLAEPNVSLHQRLDHLGPAVGSAAASRACAAMGRFEEAEEYACDVVAAARRNGMIGVEMWAHAGRGLALLAGGELDRAIDELTCVARQSSGRPEPSCMWFEADLADALLRAGRTAQAMALAESLLARCAISGTLYGTAVAWRIRGSASSNEVELHRSAELCARLGSPVERARSLLALGEYCDDADAAREAAEVFDRANAGPWAERAWKLCEGLAGGRRPSVMSQLTPAELRVAVCVGRGMTNREVAAELIVSPKTVGSHLESIYRKLSIGNRTELALLVADAAVQADG
jgi:DNA-binding CsgD family transcriptional regulator/tetratricopeptide (TPR) repeat protein